MVPVFGFQSVEDYYSQADSKPYLRCVSTTRCTLRHPIETKILHCRKAKVPVVIINARDDPFINEATLPTEEDVGDAPVKLVYHGHGGHCGFIYSQPTHEEPVHGFIAEELARAISHIHSHVDPQNTLKRAQFD